DRLKSEFVSMVSHELRTPLTSIRGGLQLVLSEAESVPDQDSRALLDRALHSSERLIRLTNDILDMSKFEAGRVDLHRAPSSVEQIVLTACEAVAHLPKGEGRIVTQVEPGIGELFVDPDRIVQALVNLVGNALKFSPVAKPVRVSAARSAEKVAIAVTDEG